MEPFIIQNFKMFAPVQVGDRQTWAHLDTGASGAMIVASEARAYEATGSRLVQGGIGRQEAAKARLPALNFLGRTFRDVGAIVFDGAEYFGDTPFPVTMTLGADILLSERLILDFKRLWIGLADRPARDDLPGHPLDCRTGLPLVELHLGDHRMNSIIDTGAAYCILNAVHVADLGIRPERIYSLEVQDPAGGKGEMPVYRVEGVRAGDTRLGVCESFVASLEQIESRLSERIDFVLGANALLSSALVWVLDRREGRLHLSERDVDVLA